MRRAAIVTLALLVLLLAAAQIALPRLAESRVEERLEKGGGSASADVSALPAARLLLRDGDSLRVRGSGLGFDLVPQERVFENLDGFDDVDIDLSASRAGPVAIDRVTLRRSGSGEAYELVTSGRASPREVADYAASTFGGPLAGLFGGLAGDVLGLPAEPLPFEFSALMESDDGRARVTDSSGSVAGLPAGPLAEIVAAAVASRL